LTAHELSQRAHEHSMSVHEVAKNLASKSGNTAKD
jgi:hypothetical protein